MLMEVTAHHVIMIIMSQLIKLIVYFQVNVVIKLILIIQQKLVKNVIHIVKLVMDHM